MANKQRILAHQTEPRWAGRYVNQTKKASQIFDFVVLLYHVEILIPKLYPDTSLSLDLNLNEEHIPQLSVRGA